MDPLELMQILQAGQGSQASPEDILTFQQNIAARNPWRIAAAPILGAKFDNRTWSPGASFATAAGQAFLGTALNGMAANREQEQMQLLAGALPSLYANPLQAQAPEGLDSGAFDSLRAPVLARQMSSRSKQLEELSKDLWSTKLQEVAAKGKRRGELAPVFSASPKEVSGARFNRFSFRPKALGPPGLNGFRFLSASETKSIRPPAPSTNRFLIPAASSSIEGSGASSATSTSYAPLSVSTK